MLSVRILILFSHRIFWYISDKVLDISFVFQIAQAAASIILHFLQRCISILLIL